MEFKKFETRIYNEFNRIIWNFLSHENLLGKTIFKKINRSRYNDSNDNFTISIYLNFENLIKFSDELADYCIYNYFETKSLIENILYDLNIDKKKLNYRHRSTQKQFIINILVFYNLPFHMNLKNYSKFNTNSCLLIEGVVIDVEETYIYNSNFFFECKNPSCKIKNELKYSIMFKNYIKCKFCRFANTKIQFFKNNDINFCKKIKILKNRRNKNRTDEMISLIVLIESLENNVIKVGDYLLMSGYFIANSDFEDPNKQMFESFERYTKKNFSLYLIFYAFHFFRFDFKRIENCKHFKRFLFRPKSKYFNNLKYIMKNFKKNTIFKVKIFKTLFTDVNNYDVFMIVVGCILIQSFKEQNNKSKISYAKINLCLIHEQSIKNSKSYKFYSDVIGKNLPGLINKLLRINEMKYELNSENNRIIADQIKINKNILLLKMDLKSYLENLNFVTFLNKKKINFISNNKIYKTNLNVFIIIFIELIQNSENISSLNRMINEFGQFVDFIFGIKSKNNFDYFPYKNYCFLNNQNIYKQSNQNYCSFIKKNHLIISNLTFSSWKKKSKLFLIRLYLFYTDFFKEINIDILKGMHFNLRKIFKITKIISQLMIDSKLIEFHLKIFLRAFLLTFIKKNNFSNSEKNRPLLKKIYEILFNKRLFNFLKHYSNKNTTKLVLQINKNIEVKNNIEYFNRNEFKTIYFNKFKMKEKLFELRFRTKKTNHSMLLKYTIIIFKQIYFNSHRTGFEPVMDNQ